MSIHDMSLIALSVVVTIFVLRRFGIVLTPLRGIFGFEISDARVLEKVLTEDELRYVTDQKMTFPQVEARMYFGEAAFEVSYEKDGLRVTDRVRDRITTPAYPTALWKCYIAEEAPVGDPPSHVLGFFERPKLTVQYESNRNRIVFGPEGGRFGKSFLGGVKEENILAKVPLLATELRSMDLKKIRERRKTEPMEYWDFIVEHEDEKIRWFASCSDIEGLVNRRRFL